MVKAEPGFCLDFAKNWELTPSESNHADGSLLEEYSEFLIVRGLRQPGRGGASS